MQLSPKCIVPCLCALLSAPTLRATANDWICAFGDASNSRRATGQQLATNWQLAWSVPQFASGSVLEQGGIVVYQTPTTSQFRAVDLATGATLWSATIGASHSNSYRDGCILAGRVFIPMGRNGSGSPPFLTSRVEARDLATGSYQWTWDATTTGAQSDLQALGASVALGTPDQVIFNVADATASGPGFVWSNLRVVALDATTPAGANPVMALASGAPYSGERLSYESIALGSSLSSAPATVWMHVYDRTASLNWASASLRAIDLVTLADPAPGHVSPALSGATPNSAPSNIGVSPVVTDLAAQRAYLYDTGGFLRAFDSSSGAQVWSTAIAPVEWLLAPYVLSTTLVLPQPGASAISAFDRATGSLLWQRTVGAGQLPAAPRAYGGVVLDGDLVLLVFANGDVRTIDAVGTLGGALVNIAGARAVHALDGHFLVSTASELRCYRPTCERVVYGTAKTNSQGCVPSIGYSGFASVSDPAPFDVTATSVINNKLGLLFYGFGQSSQSFQGGTKLVANPVQRTPLQDSGGNAPPDDCSGSYTFEFNARIQSGVDPNLVQGATVYCQYWSRDPADSFTTGLTDGLCFVICP